MEVSIRSLICDAGGCACAGLAVGPRPALPGFSRATPSEHGLQDPEWFRGRIKVEGHHRKFPEQLTFQHELEPWSLEKGVLDCRHCLCKGPEAGGWGRSRAECGRQTFLEFQGRGLGWVPAVLKGAVVASEGRSEY